MTWREKFMALQYPGDRSFRMRKPSLGSLIAVGACLVVFLLVLLGILLGSDKRTATLDNLTRMTVAFEGNYTREQIKVRLERAMILYDVPISEENYGRASSVLIVMRQDNGVPEMRILDYMIRSQVPGVKLSFPEAAALAVAFLRAGDR